MVNAVKVSSIPFTNWCGWLLWIYLDNTWLLLVAYSEWADVAEGFALLQWRIATRRELDHPAVLWEGERHCECRCLGQYGFVINRSKPNTSTLGTVWPLFWSLLSHCLAFLRH